MRRIMPEPIRGTDLLKGPTDWGRVLGKLSRHFCPPLERRVEPKISLRGWNTGVATLSSYLWPWAEVRLLGLLGVLARLHILRKVPDCITNKSRC